MKFQREDETTTEPQSEAVIAAKNHARVFTLFVLIATLFIAVIALLGILEAFTQISNRLKSVLPNAVTAVHEPPSLPSSQQIATPLRQPVATATPHSQSTVAKTSISGDTFFLPAHNLRGRIPPGWQVQQFTRPPEDGERKFFGLVCDEMTEYVFFPPTNEGHAHIRIIPGCSVESIPDTCPEKLMISTLNPGIAYHEYPDKMAYVYTEISSVNGNTYCAVPPALWLGSNQDVLPVIVIFRYFTNYQDFGSEQGIEKIAPIVEQFIKDLQYP
jgi:hypothetical protein